MSNPISLSVLIEPDLDDRLAGVAAALDRPKDWVVRRAVEDYLSMQEWQLSAIDQGLKAEEEGRVVSHAEVERWVRSWDTPDEIPMPKCG